MTSATPKPRAGEHTGWDHYCETCGYDFAERDLLRERERALVDALEQFCGFVSAGCAETGTIAAYRITLSAIHEKARVLLVKVTA